MHSFSTDVMILMTEISHAHLDQSSLPSLSSGKEIKTVIRYEAQLLLIVQISATLHRSRRCSTHTLTCYLFNTHYNNLTSQWPKLSPEHEGECQLPEPPWFPRHSFAYISTVQCSVEIGSGHFVNRNGVIARWRWASSYRWKHWHSSWL